ncbi:MAG: transketolase, partial [Actinobacteria bacterium]|nr:transketolase [Actinomycetota bacterium]
FTEDVGRRFEAYGWEILRVGDANDLDAVDKAISKAKANEDAPSLIMIRSSIACGSPNLEGCEKSHGSPLGSEETRLTKENLDWPTEEFHVPSEAMDQMRKAVAGGRDLEADWNGLFNDYRERYPELAGEYLRVMESRLPEGWEDELPSFSPGDKVATRSASGTVLGSIANRIWELTGGSADLAPSNQTYIKGFGDIGKGDFSGRNLHFGVREHGMGAIMNGMARHGGLIPYGGTFLVFSDYMRPAIRMAALMGLHVVYVFTHDSLGVGEDGPTHQPVEHLAALRSVPGLVVIRPADANETAEAWKVALKLDCPVALALSRQKLPVLDLESGAVSRGLPMGAYMVTDTQGDPDLLVLATGSEVAVAVEAARRLEAEGIKTRVVSMPSWELFEEQGSDYRKKLLPEGVKKISIEAGVTLGWDRYVGDNGLAIGIDRFGLSAPGGTALREMGMSAENIVSRAQELLK